MAADGDLVLVLVALRGAQPIRVALGKRMTSIGADAAADIRLATAPPRWAVVHRGEGHVEVSLASRGGERQRLVPGDRLADGGIELQLESAAAARTRERAIDELVSALAAVDSPERAIELLVAGLVEAAGADLGAVILADGAGWTVAAARDRDGGVVPDARELLSDTIVRDVLESGERVQLDDLAAHSRYRAVPSLAALRLGGALCLPMRLDGRTLGAVFLARRAGSGGPDASTLAELRVLAAVAVPFLAQLRRAAPPIGDDILGDAPAVQQLRAKIRRVAPTDLGVLLYGASGSGKELVARALHTASPRASQPMIAINCAAVAPTLLDAELFGYRKGAFSGAVADRVGMIEAAHGSTLFLDEIADMPVPMQAALLRVLEQREVKRLGDNLPRAVDFRLVCATHKDLDAEVAAGRFRGDLLFRLREVTLEVPSLADRSEDIVLLAHAFLRRAEQQLGLVMHALADDAQHALVAYAWPGNVRELKATMRRAAVLADSKLIRAADLGLAAPSGSAAAATAAASAGVAAPAAAPAGAGLEPLAAARDAFVRRHVEAAIAACGGDREAAARALEIGVRSLYRYLA